MTRVSVSFLCAAAFSLSVSFLASNAAAESHVCAIGEYNFGTTKSGGASIDFGKPTECLITKKPAAPTTECHLTKVERTGLSWRFVGQFQETPGTGNSNNCTATCSQAVDGACPEKETQTLKDYEHVQK